MMNECSKCAYYWKNSNDDYPHCNWASATPDDVPPCEEYHSGPEYRFSLCYFGYIFDGDSNDYNEHGYDRWSDVIEIYKAYHDSVPGMEIHDNKYSVTFANDEWY